MENCKDVIVQSYQCSYCIKLPWVHKDLCGELHEDWFINVDKCLLPEILKLWEKGIHTTGCCCGHGNNSIAYIGVRFADIDKMLELGYKNRFNPCRPDDNDSFVPKTILNYERFPEL